MRRGGVGGYKCVYLYVCVYRNAYTDIEVIEILYIHVHSVWKDRNKTPGQRGPSGLVRPDGIKYKVYSAPPSGYVRPP